MSATSVPMEKVHFIVNLESVLGEISATLRHQAKWIFHQQNCQHHERQSCVTDTKGAILSVHKGCGNGSMIVFTPNGKGNIVNDKKCIDQVEKIMASTPGFDTVHDRGAYALDVDVNVGVYVNVERRKFESDSGISFPVKRKEYWERARSQAQQDHERKESGCPW